MDAESAALIRLGGTDELAKAMIEQRQFQSWCVRGSVGAMFGVAPVLILVGAYFVACLILWSWWKIFLPRIDMPFAQLNGLANFYLVVGWLHSISGRTDFCWLGNWIYRCSSETLDGLAVCRFNPDDVDWLRCPSSREEASRPGWSGTCVSMGFSLGPLLRAACFMVYGFFQAHDDAVSFLAIGKGDASFQSDRPCAPA